MKKAPLILAAVVCGSALCIAGPPLVIVWGSFLLSLSEQWFGWPVMKR